MALECEKDKLKLLKIEIPDRYVQENFKRIEKHAENVCKDLKSLETAGVGGGDTIVNVTGAWEKGNALIPALSTTIIQVTALSNFHTLEHIMAIYNDVEGLTRRFQMTTVREGATINTIGHNRYGSLNNVQVSAVLNAGNAEITIQNDNIFDLSVSYARLTL